MMKGSKGDDRAGELEDNMLLQWFFYILCCQTIFVTHKNWQQGCVLEALCVERSRPPFPDFQAIRPYQEEIQEH